MSRRIVEIVTGPPGKGLFPTRAALVAAVAAGLLSGAGAVTFAGNQAYEYSAGATDIPDLPGLVPSGTPMAEHFGAAGDGEALDDAALQAALAAGYSPHLSKPRSYKLSTRVSITHDKTGIEGNGATIIISTAAGHFDNATYSLRYGANACGFYAVGVDRAFVRNCRITPSAWVDDRYHAAIYFNQCDDAEITGNDISGFSRAELIAFNDCDRIKVNHNKLHHCWTESTANNAFISGIIFDGDCIEGSKEFDISDNEIYSLTCSEACRSVRGVQTNGIQGMGLGTTKPSLRGKIVKNIIRYVGEGIDFWGDLAKITGNQISRAFGYGIKIGYGASDNDICGNTITDTGLAAIVLFGAANVAINVLANIIKANTIRRVGIAGDWENAGKGSGLMYDASAHGGAAAWASSDTAGIRIDAGTTSVVDKTIIESNDIDLGGTGKRGIYAETGSLLSSKNYARHNRIVSFTTAKVTDAEGRIWFEPGRVHRILLKATHTLDGGTSSQPLFNVPTDAGAFNAEANTFYRWRMSHVRLSAMSSSSGTFSFGIAGTAGINYARGGVDARKVASGTLGTWERRDYASNTLLPVVTANTATAGEMRGEGMISVSTAGTLIPSVAVSVAADAVVAVGAVFEIWEDLNVLGAAGDWS